MRTIESQGTVDNSTQPFRFCACPKLAKVAHPDLIFSELFAIHKANSICLKLSGLYVANGLQFHWPSKILRFIVLEELKCLDAVASLSHTLLSGFFNSRFRPNFATCTDTNYTNVY